MKSTLVNGLTEDKDTKVVLEEPTKENVLLKKQAEQNLLDEHQNCENVWLKTKFKRMLGYANKNIKQK